jgi:hypothetical protein
MWAFDARQGSIITDLSGNGHDITLRSNALAAIDASTCSPGVVGSAPYLTFDATHVWNTPDHNDFSLTDGAGTDIAGTFIFAGSISDMTLSTIFGKYATIGNNIEYLISVGAADKLIAYFPKNDFTKYIGRSYNTAITSYENTFVTIIVTYDGSEASGGIKIYLQGVRVDNTTNESLVYAGMSNGTALLGSYVTTAGPTIGQHLKGKIFFSSFIKGEVLTLAQITSITTLLRRYAGVAA